MGAEEVEGKARPRPAQTGCAWSWWAVNEQKPSAWKREAWLCPHLWDLEQGPFFLWGSVSPSPKRGSYNRLDGQYF